MLALGACMHALLIQVVLVRSLAVRICERCPPAFGSTSLHVMQVA